MTKLIRWTTWRRDTPPKASKGKWMYPQKPRNRYPKQATKEKSKRQWSRPRRWWIRNLPERHPWNHKRLEGRDARQSQDNGREDELAGRSNQQEVPSTGGRYKTASHRGDQEGKRENGNQNKCKFPNSGRWYEGKVHGYRQDTTRPKYIGAVHKKGPHRTIWKKGDTTIESRALKVLKDNLEIDICQNDIEISHRAAKFRPEGRHDAKKASSTEANLPKD